MSRAELGMPSRPQRAQACSVRPSSWRGARTVGVPPSAHPVPFSHQVHDYLRSKLCSLYENDCIFDKFECAWNGSDR